MLFLLQVLLRPSTWRGVWIALRRSHTGSHARGNLLRFLFALACALGGIAFEFFNFRELFRADPWFFYIFFGFIVLGTAFIVGISSFNRHRDLARVEAASPAVEPAIKKALFREAYVLAALIIRLASERGMEKELPPNLEVITRRVMLDRLRSRGFLEAAEPTMRDLLLAPDGHWSEEQKDAVNRLWEHLAVLHSALGLGPLCSPAEAPEYKLAMAYSVLDAKQPERLPVMPSWDLRVSRNQAGSFVQYT